MPLSSSPSGAYSKIVTIALDAMGGDFGPEAVVPGAAIVLEKAPRGVKFLIFGDQTQIRPILERFPALKAVSEVIHTDKVVEDNEKPSVSLRMSKGTSMRMAIESVADGRAQAVVSSGNTGSLMAMAKTVLKTLPGIHRPAICSTMPTEKGDCVMLDLGANVLVDAENLVQFAVLGAVFARVHKKIAIPTVGLLNVGTEDSKGPDHVRAAAAVLSRVQFPGTYKGFVEGDDISKGTVDVIVCDGYAGNIALKTVEGFGRLSVHYFRDAMTSTLLAKIGSLFAYFALKNLKKKLDPRLYNGGVFIGLNGLCIKSHGGADALGFSTATLRALSLAQHDYTKTVSDEINHLMAQESFIAEGMAAGSFQV
jgi:glycerol-3-phosphate acyltransferase PlsX